jgi:hypothetical protein
VHALRLALRAIWWRKGLSLTMLLVATCAITASVVGPMYGRAAEESLLRDRLQKAQLAQTGLALDQNNRQVAPVLTTGVAAPGLPPAVMLEAVTQATTDPRLQPYFPRSRVVLRTQPEVAIAGGPGQRRVAATTRVLWHQDQCAGGVTLAAGACPGPKQAAISEAAAAYLHKKVGDPLVLSPSDVPTPVPLTISGIYRPVRSSPVWFSVNYFDAARSTTADAPDRVDSVLVDKSTMLAWRGAVFADAELPLDVTAVDLADLDRLVGNVALVQQHLANLGAGGVVRVSTALPDVVDQLAADRRAVNVSAALATVQLVVLTWFVLYLVVANTIEERSDEIALAKLRGLSPGGTAAFGLAEPMILQVVAIPAGLLLGYLAATLMAHAFLLPGTEVAIRLPALLAALGAAMGAAAAAALAARSLLTRPVLEQLTGTTDPAGRLRRPIVIDAVVAALAAAGVYQLSNTSRTSALASDGLALLTPGLVALAVGLLGSRLLPYLARPSMRRTAQGDGIVGFLAARQVARRPAALRVVVLLCAAAALATFAVDAWQVGNRNRALLALQQVGAGEVVTVEAPTTSALLAAVREADPSGTRAMAVAEVIPGGNVGRVLAVDSSRLPHVAAWDPSWSGSSIGEIAADLHPRASPPVVLTGRTVSVTLTAASLPARPIYLQVSVQTAHGRVPVDLGRITTGTQTLTGELPGCPQGCRMTQLAIQRDLGDFEPISGDVVVSAMATDRGRVDAGLTALARWAPVKVNLADPTQASPASIKGSASGLELDYDTTTSYVPAIAPVDAPEVLPALFATGNQPEQVPGSEGVYYGVGLDGVQNLTRAVARPEVLPRVGRDGQMIDLEYAERLAADPDTQVVKEVWLAPGAGGVMDRLKAAGVRPVTTETAAAERAVLERQGPALALLLFLAAAAACVLLALGAAATMVYVAARHRSYEVAALRALGVRAADLTRAGTREQGVLLGSGIVLGAAAGVLAAWLALPAYPLSGDVTDGPPLLLYPAYLPILGVVALVLVLAGVVAWVGARSVVQAGTPDRLREARG